MSRHWNSTTLNTESEVFDVLTELAGKRWLCRGQSKRFRSLVPSIDRKPREYLTRIEKLSLERQSIDLYQSTAKFFSHPGEQVALADDIGALMVLRHYGVPTRLLDWSQSPYVAAYFAAWEDETADAEIWSFDQDEYGQKGKLQWKKWPKTCVDGNPERFSPGLTAFTREEPPDWFVCLFYPTGFHRQNVQHGAYTLTARFGRDHAQAIAELLDDDFRHHVYVIPAMLKATLRALLRERHGIWRGSLFPDSAGAADMARTVFPPVAAP